MLCDAVEDVDDWEDVDDDCDVDDCKLLPVGSIIQRTSETWIGRAAGGWSICTVTVTDSRPCISSDCTSTE